MPQFKRSNRPDILPATQAFDKLIGAAREPGTRTNICFCSHPVGLHWFNSERCIDCRCPGFSPIDSPIPAEVELNGSAAKHEERIPPREASA